MEQPRKPAGSPGATGGQYDTVKGGGTGDLPALSHRKQVKEERARRFREEPGWIYKEENLRATRGEHAGEAVCSLTEEVSIAERYTPRLAASLEKYFGPEQARDIAETYMTNTLIELRTNVAEDPERCYSAALVNAVACKPVHVGRILCKPPWNLSEHRMRAGLRFKKRYKQWCADHHVDVAPSRIRDRLWDEEMDAYVADKRARGVSFGRGLNYSDGRSASNPDSPITYIDESVYPPKRTRVATNPDGSKRRVFNGRKDFEVMVGRGLGHSEESTDTPGNLADTGGGAGDAEAAFKLALDRGLDERRVMDALHISEGQADRWRTEWAMHSTPGVRDA